MESDENNEEEVEDAGAFSQPKGLAEYMVDVENSAILNELGKEKLDSLSDQEKRIVVRYVRTFDNETSGLNSNKEVISLARLRVFEEAMNEIERLRKFRDKRISELRSESSSLASPQLGKRPNDDGSLSISNESPTGKLFIINIIYIAAIYLLI